MGNESGDLDSIASAIAYAFHQTQHLRNPTIPLIRIHQNNLNLRKENIYALAIAGIDNPEVQLLLPSHLLKVNQHHFALVDHNRLSPEFHSSTARVVAIIDHHVDEGLYTDTAQPRLISPTGSCASQVAAYILQDNNSDISSLIPPDLSTLLLSAILIDTGLKPVYEGGKATELDIHVARVLAPHAKFPDQVSESDILSMRNTLEGVKPSSSPSSLLQLLTSQTPTPSDQLEYISQSLRGSSPIQALSETLAAKKLDVSDLSVSDLLERDYKEYEHFIGGEKESSQRQIKVGLSTVPVRLSNFAASTDEKGDIGLLLEHGSSYMKDRGLSVLGVLTTFRKPPGKKGGKGKAAREMVWLVRADGGSSTLAQRIFKGMEANEELSVKPHKRFKRWTKPSAASDPSDHALARHDHLQLIVRVYKQGNANATRKVTAPILRQILEGPSKSW
ncbi:DHH phosphoesterase [Marasmius fiardii PR-910]|nr:DHH phosphoesterase [Marasmius fiardii PR-910]